MLKVKKFCIMIDYFSANYWVPASTFDFLLPGYYIHAYIVHTSTIYMQTTDNLQRNSKIHIAKKPTKTK